MGHMSTNCSRNQVTSDVFLSVPTLVLVQEQLCTSAAVSRLIPVPKCEVVNEQVPMHKERSVDAFLGIAVILSGYLLGSIPMGLLLVWAMTGKDVRDIGSGRTGGTNVLRAAGPWVALLAILGDVAKGLAAVWLARKVVGTPAVEALAGLMAVVGHNYSIFIGFKGGAGTMTTISGATLLWPWTALLIAVVGIPTVVITRYASVGSITVALLIPIIFACRAWLADAPWAYLIHGLGTTILTLWALRSNIKRLLQGNERRLVLRKST